MPMLMQPMQNSGASTMGHIRTTEASKTARACRKRGRRLPSTLSFLQMRGSTRISLAYSTRQTILPGILPHLPNMSMPSRAHGRRWKSTLMLSLKRVHVLRLLRLHPLTPVGQDVPQGVLKPDGRLPSGQCVELAVIPLQQRHIAGAQPVSRALDLRFDRGKAEQDVQDLSHRVRLAGAEIIGLPGLSLLAGEEISLHHVAYIGKVPARG